MLWKGLPLVVFGSGGISKEVYSLIRDINKANNQKIFDFLGFVGSDECEIGKEITDEYKVIASDFSIWDFASAYPVIGMVIPVGTPNIKAIIYDKVKSIPNAVFPNLIHPSVLFDAERTKLGKGNIITAGVILTCDIKIGDFNLINLNSTVGHDTEIGNFNVINPLVAISGSVRLNDSCLIGTGAKVLQGLNISSQVTVGAGAVVVKDVEANTTVVGIPAKPIKGK